MRRLRQLTLMAVTFTAFISGSALASSHREAPFILKNPAVDGTDFYMFQSYEPTRLTGFTTIIANYVPLQDPNGGPNYFPMDPEAIYEIHVDNNLNGVEDITFQFKFQNTLQGGDGVKLGIGPADGGTVQQVAIPLINVGPGGVVGVTAANDNGLNRLETYSVKVLRGPRRNPTNTAASAQDITNATGGSTTFKKPADYIGTKTFGDMDANNAEYAAYANAHIYTVNIPGCTGAAKMFVGQRRESFAVNLGPIFDLVNAPASVITTEAAIDPDGTGPLPATPARQLIPNPLARKNITSLALEIPTTCLTQSTTQPIIGGWTTASVRQARVINPLATYARPSREGGAWAQVSRLGNPLVNEVVIGIRDKDRWNSSEPKDDGQFANYVTHPTLPALIKALFSPLDPPIVIPRADLVAVFLTGVPSVNSVSGGATAEMLRLNTSLPPTLSANQNDLGAAGCFVEATGTPAQGSLKSLALSPAVGGTNANCDVAGFPNGRRPGDDVTDIALRVMIGYLFARDSDAPSRNIPLHDAVLQTPSQFPNAFPYLQAPVRGANGDGT